MQHGSVKYRRGGLHEGAGGQISCMIVLCGGGDGLDEEILFWFFIVVGVQLYKDVLWVEDGVRVLEQEGGRVR